MLHLVHTKGYVHGDIRPPNFVFFGDTSYLIDYDLARKVGSRYPNGYHDKLHGKDFYMRHKNAKEFAVVDKMHDRYSLHVIMTNHCSKYSITSQCTQILSDLLNLKVSLAFTANSLENLIIEESHEGVNEENEDESDMSV